MNGQPLRQWLLSDTPASRWQARLGRFYIGWLGFARNPLSLLGFAIIAADFCRDLCPADRPA